MVPAAMISLLCVVVSILGTHETHGIQVSQVNQINAAHTLVLQNDVAQLPAAFRPMLFLLQIVSIRCIPLLAFVMPHTEPYCWYAEYARLRAKIRWDRAMAEVMETGRSYGGGEETGEGRRGVE